MLAKEINLLLSLQCLALALAIKFQFARGKILLLKNAQRKPQFVIQDLLIPLLQSCYRRSSLARHHLLSFEYLASMFYRIEPL